MFVVDPTDCAVLDGLDSSRWIALVSRAALRINLVNLGQGGLTGLVEVGGSRVMDRLEEWCRTSKVENVAQRGREGLDYGARAVFFAVCVRNGLSRPG